MKNKKPWLIGAAVLVVMLAGLLGGGFLILNTIKTSIEQTSQKLINPLSEANNQLNTQVAEVLHPTPTIMPDPVTIIHQVRTLARLETIQYSVEKVIRAEEGQNNIPLLFGDKLLLVAHGSVIAGFDLQKMGDKDIQIDGKTLNVVLPQPEIFTTTLDNNQSYVYDRSTGLFSKPDVNLETQARQSAEAEIQKAALDDGILNQARINGENYLSRLLRNLGYNDVHFTYNPPL